LEFIWVNSQQIFALNAENHLQIQKGIWGLSSVTKITKTGNSLAVRIPKKIADYLKLKNGKEAYVHPENNKLIVETKL